MQRWIQDIPDGGGGIKPKGGAPTYYLHDDEEH